MSRRWKPVFSREPIPDSVKQLKPGQKPVTVDGTEYRYTRGFFLKETIYRLTGHLVGRSPVYQSRQERS